MNITTQKIIMLTENSAGVLRRATGVLSRKGHNINSISSVPDKEPEKAVITIEIECSEEEARAMIKRLNKLYDVFSARLDIDGDILYNERAGN